jgi:hypothetical protein
MIGINPLRRRLQQGHFLRRKILLVGGTAGIADARLAREGKMSVLGALAEIIAVPFK